MEKIRNETFDPVEEQIAYNDYLDAISDYSSVKCGDIDYEVFKRIESKKQKTAGSADSNSKDEDYIPF